MFTVLEGLLWMFKAIFTFFGAKDEQMKWIAKASEALHQKGWARKQMIMDLDEEQNKRLEEKVSKIIEERKSAVDSAMNLVGQKTTRNFNVLAMAGSQLGVFEWAKGSNPTVEQYLDWGSRIDNTNSGLTDDVPWCAGYVGWCLEKVGMVSTNSLMARSYERWGVSSRHNPLPGDIVTFFRGEKSRGLGHVGFFLGFDSKGNVLVLGGNQNDSVNVTAYSTSKMTDIRRSSKATKFTAADLKELEALKSKIVSGVKVNPEGSVV
jgi:uncharacterized protein (TIGR02594 family)